MFIAIIEIADTAILLTLRKEKSIANYDKMLGLLIL